MPRHKARRNDQKTFREESEQRDVRKAILDATEQLLAHQRFDELSVADILSSAQVSRASFYFYFESKYVVLGELVRRVVNQAQVAAGPWVEEDIESPEQTLRQGTSQGLQLWIQHAPVLRAIVENWRSDERLAALWMEMMEGFTQAATHRIERDRATGRAPRTSVDASTLASTLTWMSERIYYLAAIGHPAFHDEQQVIDVLTEVWLSVIYNGPPSKKRSE
ncbi:TetR/AcrR family transcriptional regulator [Ktedonobacter racemifer]|uniref:Transcriptional regulator, TetR family n=1 Tax=Ktedonobacter racemifer DSM 44963 TaxID=485913 RepID=D6TSP7_KTERA|nr:TetR/AcrR family transcriptional regulator [Ktedonobacter racemifer]EFH83448.1 transcriptional regulator, TetR family [Ktedonobacter racemifer DSM 44963]